MKTDNSSVLEVDLEALVVGGRDLLCTLASLLSVPAVRAAMLVIYGSACLRLIERAHGRDPDDVVAWVDLACQDISVVRHHRRNRSVLSGRYRTLFRSAFVLRPCQAAPLVRRIWTPDDLQARPVPDHDISLLM